MANQRCTSEALRTNVCMATGCDIGYEQTPKAPFQTVSLSVKLLFLQMQLHCYSQSIITMMSHQGDIYAVYWTHHCSGLARYH